MTPANPLSVVGLMLTLSSLLGSFFYLQLSSWVRDILAVRSKADLNQFAGTSDEKKAMRECAVEVDKLLNWPTYLVNSVVIVFIITVTMIALCMLEGAKTDPLHGPVQLAFILFLIVFIALSVILFGYGIYQGMGVKSLVIDLKKNKKLVPSS